MEGRAVGMEVTILGLAVGPAVNKSTAISSTANP